MPPVWSSRRVIPAGYAAVEVKCTGPASLHPPGFGFAVNSDDLEIVASGVTPWVYSGDPDLSFVGNLHAAYSIDRILIVTATERAELPVSLPGLQVGADLVTPAVACLVKTTTATPGRRGNGRMYWPGVLGDGDVDNAGRIDNDTRFDEIKGCADFLLTTLAGDTLDAVLLHSYRWPYGDADPGPPVGFPAPSVVTGIAVQRVVGTQRRRQR